MTLFFGGETLCELPREELVKWHTEITTRLFKSNFVLHVSDKSALHDQKMTSTQKSTTGHNNSINGDIRAPVPSTTTTTKNIEQHNNDPNDFTFSLRGFTLFPPRRNNLIVAVLDASSKWYELHNDLREIASESSSEMLRDIAKRNKPRWTAHITLGNIYGGSKQDIHTLQEVLQTYHPPHQFLTTATHTTTTIQLETSNEDNGVAVNDHDDLILTTTRSNLPITNYNRSSQDTCIVDRTTATIPLRVEKISMGGPIPNQVELHWDYCLLQRTDNNRL